MAGDGTERALTAGEEVAQAVGAAQLGLAAMGDMHVAGCIGKGEHLTAE